VSGIPDTIAFSTSGGAVSFTVSAPYSSDLGATYGNLHPKLEITDSSGNVMAGWQDPDSGSASWSGSLPAGSYWIVVGSHGISSLASANNYGFDVGTYTISGTVSTLPGFPTGVTATAADSQVTVSWNPSSGATSYNLYRATTSHRETLYQSGITTTTFSDTGLIDGTTYYYEVSAVNGSGETALSSEVQATPNPPSIVTGTASANPSPVGGTSTVLSVSGSDPFGETLTYTWSPTSEPAGANPTFSDNHSTTASVTTVTFDQAGSYTFQVILSDPSGLSNSSSVQVNVIQTESSIKVSPASPSVISNATQQFSATALDQFGSAMASQPGFSWSVNPGGIGGAINATTGLYTAPSTTVGGSDTVVASGGLQSGTAAITVIGLPAAPTNLVATSVSTSQISLSWTDKDNSGVVTAYEVLRSTNGTSGWSVLASNLGATATSYSDTHRLSAGTTYYYEVLAVNHTTASSPSNMASAATWPAAPSQPGSLTGAGVYNTANPAQGAVNLAWQDKGATETSYSVERSKDNKTWTVLTTALPPNATSYSDTGLSPSTKYYYRVRAFDGPSLVSSYTSTASATTPAFGPVPMVADGSEASPGSPTRKGSRGAGRY
jgi:fibronectin type 3 domain-containing protein